MTTEDQDYLHPDDDVPYVIELRKDLRDAFLATVRRYELNGLSSVESREEASAFMRSVFKKVTLDIEPDIERASFKEFWSYLTRLQPKLLWTMRGAIGFVIFVVFSIGYYVGSYNAQSNASKPGTGEASERRSADNGFTVTQRLSHYSSCKAACSPGTSSAPSGTLIDDPSNAVPIGSARPPRWRARNASVTA